MPANDGKWKTIEPPKKRDLGKQKSITGTYEANFTMANHSDPAYKRSESAGTVTRTWREFKDGSATASVDTRTGRTHTHFGAASTIVTAPHTPTDGDTASGLRKGAVVKWQK